MSQALTENKSIKICDKDLFSNNVEWSSEKLWKMMSADDKLLWVPSTLKVECEKGAYFPIQLDYDH